MKTLYKVIPLFVLLPLLLFPGCSKKDKIECNYNIYIPDSAFKYSLLKTWVVPKTGDEGYLDENGDGEICDAEAARITELNVNNRNIRSIEGVEHFNNLEIFDCSGCNIQSISFSSSKLIDLNCSDNSLTELNVSEMVNLTRLICSENMLSSIDLSKNTELRFFASNKNLLSSIDLSNNVNLSQLYIDSNYLSMLDVDHLSKIVYLHFADNQIEFIDLSNNLKLSSLRFTRNPLNEIDLTNNPDLTWISFGNNPMSVLDISVNYQVNLLDNEDDFPFEKICVWTLPFPPSGTCVKTLGFPDDFEGFEICE